MTARGALLAGIVVVVLCGCRGSGRSVFLGDDDSPADRSPRRVVTLTGAPPAPTPIPMPEPSPLVAGDARAPAVAAPMPPDEAPVVVDAKVGDVNGRPIFASEVLDKGLADRLTQDARREGATEDAWEASAKDLIRGSVERIVADELIEAEARAALEPQERQGLRYWLRERREEARRKASGSRVLLEQQLRDEGRTMEDWERDTVREALIDRQVQLQVRDRAMVTWPDIKFYYEVNQKQFNPDPTARLRLIRVLTDDQGGVRSVQSALDRGDPFEKVAALGVNTFNRDAQGADVQPLSGDYAGTRLYGADELNDAAHGLRPGEWTHEPVRSGAFSVWIKLESVETLRRPLSDPDVQREIVKIVGNRKRQEVYKRYLARLIEGAHVTGFDEMTDRLYEIARQRYWTTRG